MKIGLTVENSTNNRCNRYMASKKRDFSNNIGLSLKKAIIVSALNQGVGSVTNYALNIYLVRILTPEAFGVYGICFAIVLFLVGLGNALLLTQMVVILPDRLEADKLRFASSILAGIVIFVLAIVIVGVLFIAVLDGTVWEEYGGLGLMVTFAASALLIKEFFVRLAYSLHVEYKALLVNSAVGLTLCALIVSGGESFAPQGATNGLKIYTWANGVGAIVGLLLSSIPLRSILVYEMGVDFRQAWQGGRWAALAHAILSARGQAYVFLSAALLGPLAVAKINAARLFVAPVLMSLPAINQVLLPRIAETRRNGIFNLGRDMIYLLCCFYGGIVAYSIFLSVSANELGDYILGKKYGGLYWMTIMWCMFLLIASVKSHIELFLVAQQKFRVQANINFIIAPVSLFITYLLIIGYQEQGAIMGSIVSEALVGCFLGYFVWRQCRRHPV